MVSIICVFSVSVIYSFTAYLYQSAFLSISVWNFACVKLSISVISIKLSPLLTLFILVSPFVCLILSTWHWIVSFLVFLFLLHSLLSYSFLCLCVLPCFSLLSLLLKELIAYFYSYFFEKQAKIKSFFL